MLKVTRMTVNNFDEVTYILADAETGDTAVVDPGLLFDEERRTFDRFLQDNHLTLTQIILTHGHVDHCFGADYVKNRYGVPVKAHSADKQLIGSLPVQAARFGMAEAVAKGLELDVELSDGDTIDIGKSRLHVIHVPGHSPGGIALYDKEDQFILVGDSLFSGSIGRTDLPGGDHTTLVDAIKKRLLTLPPDTLVLPGHGEATRIGHEATHNSYLKDLN